MLGRLFVIHVTQRSESTGLWSVQFEPLKAAGHALRVAITFHCLQPAGLFVRRVRMGRWRPKGVLLRLCKRLRQPRRSRRTSMRRHRICQPRERGGAWTLPPRQHGPSVLQRRRCRCDRAVSESRLRACVTRFWTGRTTTARRQSPRDPPAGRGLSRPRPCRPPTRARRGPRHRIRSPRRAFGRLRVPRTAGRWTASRLRTCGPAATWWSTNSRRREFAAMPTATSRRSRTEELVGCGRHGRLRLPSRRSDSATPSSTAVRPDPSSSPTPPPADPPSPPSAERAPDPRPTARRGRVTRDSDSDVTVRGTVTATPPPDVHRTSLHQDRLDKPAQGGRVGESIPPPLSRVCCPFSPSPQRPLSPYHTRRPVEPSPPLPLQAFTTAPPQKFRSGACTPNIPRPLALYPFCRGRTTMRAVPAPYPFYRATVPGLSPTRRPCALCLRHRGPGARPGPASRSGRPGPARPRSTILNPRPLNRVGVHSIGVG